MMIKIPSLRTAYDRCHKRKQRCIRLSSGDDDTPCRRCEEADEKCVFSPPCRLGRPTNKSKQQEQQPTDNSSLQEVDVPRNVVAANASSRQIQSSRNNNQRHFKKRSRSQIAHDELGPANGQHGRVGRPQWVQDSPSKPRIASPFSTVSAPEASEETMSSVPLFASAVPSLDWTPSHFRESTTSVRQKKSAQLQSHHTRQQSNYPTSVPRELYYTEPNDHVAAIHVANMNRYHGMWNSPLQDGFGIQNWYNIGLSDMQPIHSTPSQQPQQPFTPNGHVNMIDPTTPEGSDTSMNMQQNQHCGKANSTKPFTPPLMLAYPIDCVRGYTTRSPDSGFIYTPFDTYLARSPWINDVSDSFHAVYDKSTEDHIIIPATLA